MADSTVIITPDDEPRTIVFNGPEPIGEVIVGGDNTTVITSPTDIVVIQPPAPTTPNTIILGPDQLGTVVIGDNPVTALLSTPEITVIGSDVPGPRGPQGPRGEGAGEADLVSYDGAFPNVQAALDALLYVSPRINSFTNSVGTVEIGTTISAVTLGWSLNKTMTSLALDHSLGSVLDLTSKTLTGLTLTNDTTYTLTASDGKNTVSASTTVAFRNKRYWGVSPEESLDNAGILALSGSEFATNFNKAVTYNATGGRFLYFAFPASFGIPSHVTVGGLSFTDFSADVVSVTNASGHIENYNVCRFRNMQTGPSISVVWA
jgi:hypothetical protein